VTYYLGELMLSDKQMVAAALRMHKVATSAGLDFGRPPTVSGRDGIDRALWRAFYRRLYNGLSQEIGGDLMRAVRSSRKA
jgi:hypothetical protein